MKKIYITIPLILAIVSFTGCKKFLETAPDMRTQLNSPQKVAELLATAYTQADYVTFTETASDNAEDKGPNFTSAEIDPRNTNPYFWSDVESRDEGSPTNFWNSSYAAIAASNAALDAISKSTDAAYLPYKGEALVARAYAHFMLVVLYAKMYDPAGANDSPGVPYVTTPEKVVFGQYTRGTVATTYAAIEKDLLEGLPLIRNTAYSIPKYHFNIAAANAFAARFYLFKKEYQKVIDYANLAVPNNTFAANLRPWNTRYYNYAAAEMRIAFTQASEASTLLLTEAPSLWARYHPYYRFGMGLNISSNAANERVKPNATGTYWTAQRIYGSGSILNNFQKWNELFIRVSANANTGYPYTILPQFTVDELLMNRAEAYANLAMYPQAIADMNTFASTRILSYSATTHAVTQAKIISTATAAGTDYTGAAITDLKQQYIYCILDFKRKEFLQEGLRWFDEIRNNYVVKHNLKPLIGSDTYIYLQPSDLRRVFQIPSEAALSGVAQNPR